MPNLDRYPPRFNHAGPFPDEIEGGWQIEIQTREYILRMAPDPESGATAEDVLRHIHWGKLRLAATMEDQAWGQSGVISDAVDAAIAERERNKT